MRLQLEDCGEYVADYAGSLDSPSNELSLSKFKRVITQVLELNKKTSTIYKHMKSESDKN
jgi:hypothetical protein